MNTSSRSGAWAIGWSAGTGVVLVAASLLGVLIALALRIARQADEIAAGLNHAERNTAGLWHIQQLNKTLDDIGTGLRPAGSKDGQ